MLSITQLSMIFANAGSSGSSLHRPTLSRDRHVIVTHPAHEVNGAEEIELLHRQDHAVCVRPVHEVEVNSVADRNSHRKKLQ